MSRGLSRWWRHRAVQHRERPGMRYARRSGNAKLRVERSLTPCMRPRPPRVSANEPGVFRVGGDTVPCDTGKDLGSSPACCRGNTRLRVERLLTWPRLVRWRLLRVPRARFSISNAPVRRLRKRTPSSAAPSSPQPVGSRACECEGLRGGSRPRAVQLEKTRRSRTAPRRIFGIKHRRFSSLWAPGSCTPAAMLEPDTADRIRPQHPCHPPSPWDASAEGDPSRGAGWRAA